MSLSTFDRNQPASLPLRRDPHRRQAIAGGCLIVTAILLVAFGRHAPTSHLIDPAEVVHSVELKFEDLPDGTIVAFDAEKGHEISRIAPGVGGFVRVTMRSFAAERRHDGFGDSEPFLLARMNDGDLRLQDPLTGRQMLLNAFGPSNEGAFAELIDHGRTEAMNAFAKLSREAIEVPCTIEIVNTWESLRAHVELDGVEVGPGDEVHVHGPEIVVPYGDSVTLKRMATVTKASAPERLWVKMTGDFEFMELLEFSFSSGEKL